MNNCKRCNGSGTQIIAERDGDSFWHRCIPCDCQSDALITIRSSQWAWLNQCAKDLADLKERHKGALDDIEKARVIATEVCAMLVENGIETNYPPMPWGENE